MDKNPEDSAMRQTHRAVLLVGASFVLIASSFYGLRVGFSVFAGAAVAAINLYVLSRAVHSLLEGQRSTWAGIAVPKFLILLAVTYGLIESGLVQPLGLAAGFGCLPLGILLAGTFGAAPTKEAPAGPRS